MGNIQGMRQEFLGSVLQDDPMERLLDPQRFMEKHFGDMASPEFLFEQEITPDQIED